MIPPRAQDDLTFENSNAKHEMLFPFWRHVALVSNVLYFLSIKDTFKDNQSMGD